MEPSKLFEDKADLYAASRPMYPKALFHFIASLVSSHGDAWDCATGNGQAAVNLAEVFTRVEATDISKKQIANCFTAENVNYSVQPAEATSFADDQFDLVSVAQALHWFDYEKFWDEVARVLKPNGMFVAFSYGWPFVDREIDRIVEAQITNVIEPYWAPNNKLAWDAYKSVDFPFTPIETPRIDLENHWNPEEFLNYLHTWSGTRRCMDDIGSGFFEDARAALMRSWGNPAQKKIVTSPLTIIAGPAW